MTTASRTEWLGATLWNCEASRVSHIKNLVSASFLFPLSHSLLHHKWASMQGVSR